MVWKINKETKKANIQLEHHMLDDCLYDKWDNK